MNQKIENVIWSFSSKAMQDTLERKMLKKKQKINSTGLRTRLQDWNKLRWMKTISSSTLKYRRCSDSLNLKRTLSVNKASLKLRKMTTTKAKIVRVIVILNFPKSPDLTQIQQKKKRRLVTFRSKLNLLRKVNSFPVRVQNDQMVCFEKSKL